MYAPKNWSWWQIIIDSAIRMVKKNYPQVYLEECKYKTKKTKITKFKNAELESESELESETELNWHWIIVEFLLIIDDCSLNSCLLLWTSQKLTSYFTDFK